MCPSRSKPAVTQIFFSFTEYLCRLQQWRKVLPFSLLAPTSTRRSSPLILVGLRSDCLLLGLFGKFILITSLEILILYFLILRFYYYFNQEKKENDYTTNELSLFEIEKSATEELPVPVKKRKRKSKVSGILHDCMRLKLLDILKA